MADSTIAALPAVTTAAGSDVLPVVQGGTDKKATLTQVSDFLKTIGVPRAFALASAHTISSATATEVTGLGPVTLEAGTYQFQFFLICSAVVASTSGIRLGLNFTGTAAQRAFNLRYPGTGTAANTGIADDVGAATGQLHESNPQTAYSTTTPNMGNTGFATANGKVLMVVEGTVVVTASGDLELWHGSSGAVSTTVDAGSTLIVVRCA